MAHNVYPPERPLSCSQHQPNHHTANRSSKIPKTILRWQVKLERTHRQKKKTDLKTKNIKWLTGKKIPSIYRKQIAHLQSGNPTDMELRNRTVGLRQQVQRTHRAEISIKNSQSHTNCTPVCTKSYATYRLQHPLPK